MPVVDVDPATLAARELVPFAAASDAGVAAVMTSHIVVPRDRPGAPGHAEPEGALRAPRAARLRRRRSSPTRSTWPAPPATAASPRRPCSSLMAGADLLCLGADKDVALVREVQAAIVAAVRSGRLPEQRLVEAADRIAGLEPYGPAARPPRRATSRWRSWPGARAPSPSRATCPELGRAWVVSVDTEANIAVGDVPWGLPSDRAVAPGPGRARRRPCRPAAGRPGPRRAPAPGGRRAAGRGRRHRPPGGRGRVGLARRVRRPACRGSARAATPDRDAPR